MNVRVLAWRILRARHATPLRLAEAVASRARLEARDRRLLVSLIGIELRRRGTLLALVRQFGGSKADGNIGAHLGLGFVQAFFLDRIPDYAVVAETVRAARITHGERHGRIVERALKDALAARSRGHADDPRRDLVMRDVSFSVPIFHDPREHPLLWAEEALSMPVALFKRWSRRYGEAEAIELARGTLEEPDLSVRVVRGDCGALQAELSQSDIAARPGNHPHILLVPRVAASRFLHSAAFTEGRATVQGETALRAAELLQVQRDEHVLDLCAAPGGKTAVCAAQEAHVVARDVDDRRMARVQSTLLRLGFDGKVELRPGRGSAGLTPQSFDAVLVDAPCSNTGVLGKRPAARWRFSTESQAELGALQVALLSEGARCLRPGGRLVYSTCSIEPEENQRRVRTFLAERPEFTLEAEHDALPRTRAPHGPLDGGYAARIRLRRT